MTAPDVLATDVDTTLAAGKEIKATDLTNGVIDYSLKSLEGSHKSRFIYVNMTEDGEVVGNAPSPKVTLAVENAELDNQHAQVVYRSGTYYLRDLNSSSGTWLKFGNPTLIKIEDKMEIYISGDIFEFEYGEKMADPLHEYVKLFGLDTYYDEFVHLGLDSVEKLRTIQVQDVQRMRNLVGPNNAELLTEMCMAHKKILVDGFIDRKLIVKGKTRKLISEHDWTMFTIGNLNDSSINVSNFEDLDNVRPQNSMNIYEVQVIYQQGCYWLMSNKTYAEPDLYVRVKVPNPEIELRPDDTIKIGKLKLKVCRFNLGKLEHKGSSDQLVEKTFLAQDLGVSTKLDMSLFCLFDGHDRSTYCVRYVSDLLPITLKEKLHEAEESGGGLEGQSKLLGHLKTVIEQSFSETDASFLKTRITNMQDKDYNSGCTGLVLLIYGDLAICANLGDSRAIVSRCKKALRLSQEHTISLQSESRRIRELAGTDSDLLGSLPNGVTRSFGRILFKSHSLEGFCGQPIVSASPDLRHVILDYATDDFMILGSDGLFASLTNQQVVDFVYDKLASMPIGSQDPQKVADELVKFSIEKNAASHLDAGNVSALIVCLNRGISQGDHSPSRYSDISPTKTVR